MFTKVLSLQDNEIDRKNEENKIKDFIVNQG